LRASVTGYRHPSCYANDDSNCSTKISKEHFLSAALLRRLQQNKKVKVAGLSWQEPKTFGLFPIGSLGANILCRDHNGALSSLDDSILRFVDAIHAIDQEPHSRRECFSGADIERWMLKYLVGLTCSGNTRGILEPYWIDILFGRSEWREGSGLYFAVDGAGPSYHTDSFLVETIKCADGIVRGARFFLQGLPFNLILGKPGTPDAFGVWRPRGMIFKRPESESRVEFKWASACGETAVILDRIGTYNGPPPVWHEWERNG
jgi:hypothetical protein